MAEYIERETVRKAVRSKTMTKYDWSEEIDFEDFEKVLDAIPAADVVPVVRCKDCQHSGVFRSWFGNEYVGCRLYPEEIHSVDPEHFCSYGKRKVGE